MSSSSSASSHEEEEEAEEEEEEEDEEEENGRRRGGREGPPGIEEHAAARLRFGNGVWPEPFIEALAVQTASNAARENGRLAAAPALVSLFQVCSTWHAVSRSELLWEALTRRIWGRDRCLRPTWHHEFVYRHRTVFNFRHRRAVYTHLHFQAPPAADNDALVCRCLALSDRHLAGGFLDGTVRLFDIPSGRHVRTFRPRRRDRFGQFSRAVAGIVLHDTRVVFASLDGDIHVAGVQDAGPTARRVHLGNVVNDGTLVDFTGCSRWWVGLYAGVPGRTFHVWDGETEELVFVGGSLTDSDAVLGWHMLTELNESVGRVRVSGESDSGVASTSLKIIAFDMRQHGVVVGEEEPDGGVVVDSVDVSKDLFLSIDNQGVARVRRVRTFEQVSEFSIYRRGGSAAHQRRRVLGCLNTDLAFVFSGGAIRTWDIETGQSLYRFRERIGEAMDLVSDDERVASCSPETGIHLWNFSGV